MNSGVPLVVTDAERDEMKAMLHRLDLPPPRRELLEMTTGADQVFALDQMRPWSER